MNPIRSLSVRPVLLGAIIAGVVAGVALAMMPNPFPPSARPLVAWDVYAAFYLIATNWALQDDPPAQMARRAAQSDEGRGFFLLLCLLAAGASVWAVALEFHQAKGDHEPAKTLHIAFAMGTVALSWLYTHVVFAVHYAHEYYGPDDGKKVRGGLRFPGHDKDPDWWDFLHFALVIGVANQTADVQIEQREMRRIVTWHGIVAFLFNTVIVAFTVNLAASLL